MPLLGRKKDKGPKKEGRLRQIINAYKMTREQDPRAGIICLAWAFGVAIVVGVVIGFFISIVSGVIVGILSGSLTWLFVFGRRAEAAAYKRVEGRPGAAGAALGVLKRGWHVQQGVAVTRNQELVHRVVGRPGVILVGEGNPSRVRNLLAVEKKKHARVVGDTPIYDVAVTDHGEDGTVAVRRLSKHITKLPKNITPADMTDVMQRLKALDAMRPPAPLPKGPLPTNPREAKRQARQAMRGR